MRNKVNRLNPKVGKKERQSDSSSSASSYEDYYEPMNGKRKSKYQEDTESRIRVDKQMINDYYCETTTNQGDTYRLKDQSTVLNSFINTEDRTTLK